MDIFEKLKAMVGCTYISDLKFAPYKEMALELLSDITDDNKAEIYKYIMGVI